MNKLKNILKKYYEIDAIDISPQRGGWSALAFKVMNARSTYFLKMYEKNRVSTIKWTASIDHYVPIMIWLLNNSGLTGKIPVPILTQSGDYKCEDDEGIYLLYKFIDGETIGENNLTEKQVINLSEIVAELHSYGKDLPFVLDEIKEDFNVPFLSQIRNTLNKEHLLIPKDVWELISPYIREINRLVDSIEKASLCLKNNNDIKMVLCHTDLHHWNLMQTEQNLMLIDWEGLRLAPIEADLMFVMDKPYEELFLHNYRKIHRDFEFNSDMLQFYQRRRKLEDIWEFIEQLLFDDQDGKERMITKNHLINELRQID